MKNSFPYRTTSGHTRGKNRLIAATVIVVLIVGVDFASQGAIRMRLHAGGAFLVRWVHAITGSVTESSVFTSRKALESQNRALLEKLSQLEERAASYQALKVENTELRALVHIVEGTEANPEGGITAPIVSSVSSSPYGTFLIGAGLADGIAPGSFVLTSNGFIIGVVGTIGPHVSIVREIFAPGATTEATVGGAPIAVIGAGGGNARAKLSRGLPVQVGDPVVSPLFGQRPIGIVGNVASSSASALQNVYIRLPVNLYSVRYVYVISTNN